jgi:four helix bundle protein
MNYRSATRGRSRAEFIAKLGIAVEEADEALGWLELSAQVELARGPELVWLLHESNELLAILAASQKTARRNLQFSIADRRLSAKSEISNRKS